MTIYNFLELFRLVYRTIQLLYKMLQACTKYIYTLLRSSVVYHCYIVFFCDNIPTEKFIFSFFGGVEGGGRLRGREGRGMEGGGWRGGGRGIIYVCI
jgi:hypothetical protein